MGLSALIADIKTSNIALDTKTNYRKYYDKYPHAIRVSFAGNKQPYSSELVKRRNIIRDKIKSTLKEKFKPEDYAIRYEFLTLTIFCKNINKVAEIVRPNLTKRDIEHIKVERMDADVDSETSIRPDLPRAHTVVVKKLPHDKYRYKVYWPATRHAIQRIGAHSLEAIVDQINADPTCKPLKPKTARQIIGMGYQYGSRYFYTSCEDIFSIISLINPSFINRIEKFITIEEMNEKNIS